MAHDVSASYFRFDHMSPSALALAFLLHALTALALWWMSAHRPELPSEEPIEVTIEQPKPESPKPAPQAAPQPTPSPAPAAAAPPPSPPVRLGLPQPAPSSPEPPQRQPSTQESLTPESAKQAQPPQPSTPPSPPVEEVVPPPAPPPPPPSALDFPKPAITPVPRPPPKPPQPPQRAQTPPQQLRTSPLSSLPRDNPSSPSREAAPSGLVNPNEAATKSRAIDAYLWQVVRKFSQYLPNLRDKNEEGTVVLRLVIARDGRLVDVSIAQSSGRLILDKAVLETIRVAAPYAPLPAEVPGEQVTFSLPITSKVRQ